MKIRKHVVITFLKAHFSKLTLGLLLVTAGSSAFASIVAIPEFIGSSNESFESFSPGSMSTPTMNYISGPDSILGGTANLSGINSNTVSYPIYVWSSIGGLSLGGGVSAVPFDGTKGIVLNGSTPMARIDFTTPTTKFGGYWGAAFNGTIDLTFYDNTDAVIGSDSVTYSLSGPLEWFGWMSTAGDPAIAAVEWTGYWATVDGLQTNVSAVPVPAAVWLFGSGLIGLISMVKRKKT